jgi:hypothetical protein
MAATQTSACQRSVLTSFLMTLFVALMLVILYLYHQLNNCRYDYDLKKNFNVHYYVNTNDSYFYTNKSMTNF